MKTLTTCSRLAKDIDNVCAQVEQITSMETQEKSACKFQGERFLISKQLSTKFRASITFEDFKIDSYCAFVLTQTSVT